eukprot:gene10018-12286_t
MAQEHGMIEPFVERQMRGEGAERLISFGVSSYGYDVRCADEFKVFTNINSATVDPKNFDEKSFVDVKSDVCIIPPNSFALARTVEFFRIPRNVLTICLGKSTYARCGIIVNVTPLEPEWEGHMLFFESDEECEVSYKDRGGKLREFVSGHALYWVYCPDACTTRRATLEESPMKLDPRISAELARLEPNQIGVMAWSLMADPAAGGIPGQPGPDDPWPNQPEEPGEPTLPDEPPPAPVA